MAEAIKVAVRVRPFNDREKKLGSKSVVEMHEKTTTVGDGGRAFTYDFSYSSMDVSDENFASQETVYNSLGRIMVENALNGYNGSMFAYGQTGSGKSYSVMGFRPKDPGLIPRAIDDIFGKVRFLQEHPEEKKEARVWLSYIEIYNESIRDLLTDSDESLNIVEHPKLGVIIPKLAEAVCKDEKDVHNFLDFGTNRRVTASTAMNATSSRSHAVFTLRLEILEGDSPEPGGKDTRRALSAKLNLADLAGSERQSKTGAEGSTLREGAAINQSLSSLALIIKDLSENIDRKQAGKKEAPVSFRSSKLTFLLKDSLAGNARTIMLAAISPASDNLQETLTTLRFAASVKKIKTVAKKNMDKRDEIITDLKAENDKLRQQMMMLAGKRKDGPDHDDDDDAPDDMKLIADRQLRIQELVENMGDSYADQVSKTKVMRRKTLKFGGLLQEMVKGVGRSNMTPFLQNMSDDPMWRGTLTYYIPENQAVTVGAGDSTIITMKGLVVDHLATMNNEDNDQVFIEKVSTQGRVCVNGSLLQEGENRQLQNGDRVYLARTVGLRLVIPVQRSESSESLDQGLSLEGLEEEWSALDDSKAWAQVEVDKLHRQMQPQLFAEMKRGCTLCDEANEMTEQCRPEERLYFEVDYTSAVPSTVLIRVLQHSGEEDDSKAWNLLYPWTIPQMEQRLDGMRDVYTAWLNGTQEIDQLTDPWHEPNIGVIKQRLAAMEAALEEQQEQAELTKVRELKSMGKMVLFWQTGSAEELLRSHFNSWLNFAKEMRIAQAKGNRMTRRAAAANSSPSGMTKTLSVQRPANASIRKTQLGRDRPVGTRDAQASTSNRKPAGGRGPPNIRGVERAYGRGSGQTPRVAAPEPPATADEREPFQEPPAEQEFEDEARPPTVQLTSRTDEDVRFDHTSADKAKSADDAALAQDALKNCGAEVPEDLIEKEREVAAGDVAAGGEKNADVLTSENESLKRQLQAAWQLCNILRTRMREQELQKFQSEDLVEPGVPVPQHYHVVTGAMSPRFSMAPQAPPRLRGSIPRTVVQRSNVIPSGVAMITKSVHPTVVQPVTFSSEAVSRARGTTFNSEAVSRARGTRSLSPRRQTWAADRQVIVTSQSTAQPVSTFAPPGNDVARLFSGRA